MSEALELQIEVAWVALTRMSVGRSRTLHLTRGRRVVWSANDRRATELVEIGTYTRGVSLAELREDVFYSHANYREAT
ncbi:MULTISPECIES: hypothetical protein [unclassified Lysobacter]|uniref:hypothetical protein n=1 Tax=unclassified Lysobacter TaxID=2635362 RepID=UPI0007008DB2|nr:MULTISPECIES: hypothetical protein [unclassified Lysobacter]KRC35098.1 hypothetical protein ASE10_10535 [Lysobacter sp. Root76]KRD70786.1 hypothetical protein ASE45_02700 [Lysobacter sp. Root96]